MATRIAQAGVLVLAAGDPKSRVVQAGVMVLADKPATMRVAQAGVMVIYEAGTPVRVAQAGVMVIARVPANATSEIKHTVELAPEVPIEEVWEWLTDVIVSDDGAEQRFALRDCPRRTFTETIEYSSEAELRKQTYGMFAYYNGLIFVPLYAYQVRLKIPSIIGDNVLFANTERSEFREGEHVYVTDGVNSQIAVIAWMDAEKLVLDNTLSFNFSARSTVMPVSEAVAGNNAVVSRVAPDGSASLKLKARERNPLTPFLRPTNTQVLPTFDDLVLLDKRAIGTSFDQGYDTGYKITDNETGIFDIRSSWKQTRIVYELTYLCHRVMSPNDWDHWKAFADYCKGSANPFLVSTYRPDIEPVSPIAAATDAIEVAGSQYSELYFPHANFRRIAIETKAGTHLANVVSAAPDEYGNDVIVFAPALPVGVNWQVNQKVSFLLKVRISNDEIKLEHHDLQTFVNFSIRTVD